MFTPITARKIALDFDKLHPGKALARGFKGCTSDPAKYPTKGVLFL